MAYTMSINAGDKCMGVSRAQIYQQLQRGVIVRGINGKLDWQQVMSSYGIVRQGRRSKADNTDDGKRSVTAKMARGIANLRLCTATYERAAAKFIERDGFY